MIKILVCDDERDIVSALRIFLTGQGYEVIEAYNGDEAIRAVRRGGISLCLLDVMMPVTDGLTAPQDHKRGIKRPGDTSYGEKRGRRQDNGA